MHSARLAPPIFWPADTELGGMGLLEAIPESEVIAWADPEDEDNDGIKSIQVGTDPETGETRLD